ncbi:MAG: AraC family transcriptional regulator [Thermoflexales bacterium]|nr:AraC family transcriptional regulator [Thermoflexales bacterium]
MSNTRLIADAIDFMEDKLQAELVIADAAEAVACSLFHFCRLFNQLTHHTPYDYLLRRRLSESARELLESERKIIDVALDYQFNGPETYSRAFKRMFGVQPSQWKKHGRIPRRSLLPRLTLDYIEHVNQGDYLKPVPVEREAFCVAGFSTLVRGERQAADGLWKMLGGHGEGIEDAARYGIVSYPSAWEGDDFFYMAAVKVESPHVTNPSLVVKTIPAMSYARFIHKGRARELELSLAYIYHTWLPKSGLGLACPLEIEEYGPAFVDGPEAERAIYVPVT